MPRRVGSNGERRFDPTRHSAHAVAPRRQIEEGDAVRNLALAVIMKMLRRDRVACPGAAT